MRRLDLLWVLPIPTVRFYSDIQYDPFLFMAQKRKVYGWAITIVETANTIPTLFDSMLEWRDEVTRNNSLSYKFGGKTKLADWQRKDELWDFFMTDNRRRKDGSYEEPEKYSESHQPTRHLAGGRLCVRALTSVRWCTAVSWISQTFV